MRTVLIHLDASRTLVEAALAQSYPAQAAQWIAYEAGEPVLYIGIDSLEHDVDPDARQRLLTALGEVVTTVCVDISGRHAGDPAVRRLVTDLLTRFRGLAEDDYSPHFWTLRELEASATFEGHPFFDYAGWHASNRRE